MADRRPSIEELAATIERLEDAHARLERELRAAKRELAELRDVDAPAEHMAPELPIEVSDADRAAVRAIARRKGLLVRETPARGGRRR